MVMPVLLFVLIKEKNEIEMKIRKQQKHIKNRSPVVSFVTKNENDDTLNTVFTNTVQRKLYSFMWAQNVSFRYFNWVSRQSKKKKKQFYDRFDIFSRMMKIQ